MSEASRHIHIGQRFTFRESSIAYRVYTLRNGNRGEGFALSEGIVTNHTHTGWQRHFGERSTLEESSIANSSNGLRDREMDELRHTRTERCRNRGDRVTKDHGSNLVAHIAKRQQTCIRVGIPMNGCKRLAIIKSMAIDSGHTGWNMDLLNSRTSIKRLITNILYTDRYRDRSKRSITCKSIWTNGIHRIWQVEVRLLSALHMEVMSYG